MIKIIVCIVGLTAVVSCAEPGRPQPRLLFYDEEGSLVKTSSNPYLQNLRLRAGLPHYGSFLDPIFGFIKDFGNIFTFIVPVSNAVIEQMKRDPQYQNQLMALPVREPRIEPNPLCNGLRAQIPSPNVCNNYLNCWDGWAVEQECPRGLLFSNQGYCDYSDNVICGARKLREQPPSQPPCKTDFETFRNLLDCSEFYVCVNRDPVKFKCPGGLAYSQYLGVCDYPERVNCASSAPATGIYGNKPSSPALPASPSIPASPPKPLPEAPSAVIPSAPSAIIPPAPSDIMPTVPPPPTSTPAPTIPAAPISPPALPKPPSPELPASPSIHMQPAMKPEDIKTIYSEHSVFNTQGWTSINIATSLQDAINQLQRKNLVKTVE